MHAVKELDAESKQEDDGTALEQQSDTTTKESSEHFSSTEAKLSRGATGKKLEKERDCSQQREAVIRPQQAGKIDFKSLQNRSKFATDRTWSSGKGSPQSPSGKGRSREKGKRSGKAERSNPQQLDRLSVTNPRTVGIAYPQQKVLPPKKLETSRGPVSGSYRFYISSVPERQVELQQEELNYSHCFQETPQNSTSPSYTSQALGSSSGTSSNHHPSLSQQQQPASMESNSVQPSNQLILTDFQLSGSNTWQSPERTFNGANFGLSSQKPAAHPDASKAGGFAPAPFHYGYHLSEESIPSAFPCEQNAQSHDFPSSSLGHVLAHNSFTFTPGDGQTIAHSGAQFNSDPQPENRNSYPLLPQSQFIQGMASSIQCPRNLSEDSASSDSLGSSSQPSEQGKTLPPESRDTILQADSQDAAITSGSKRNCHPKDAAASQRTPSEGGVHLGSISQSPSSPMHFHNRTFNNPPVSSICTGSVPFDKSIKVLNRLTSHSWDGSNKSYSPADQNTPQYTDVSEKFSFQNLSSIEQRPNSSKSSRMLWQQIRLPPAMANTNRIELSRQVSNQKLAYIVSPSDWQDESKSHISSTLKKPSSFQNSRGSEGFLSQRQESVKHSNPSASFKVEMGHPQVCESKSKTVYFGLNQSISRTPARNFSYPQLQVSPMGLMMVSPYESPLPSPIQNPSSSSTCSSLSPASTSPVNISSEDSLMSKSASSHSFYHHSQSKAHLHSDHLSTQSHQFHSDAPQILPYAADRAKEDANSYQQHSTLPKTSIDANKGYIDSFGMEHHQPPPPYSAHQLLASSLATANLDQLDVLLTCKQCDQNFSNLASFLGHKQYCAQHTFAQTDLKDVSKMEDTKKFHADAVKSAVSNVSPTRCPSDLHLSLLGLNKNGELMSDSDNKGDNKDDPLKLSLFSSSGNLPVPLPELEMEDPKLDSLITEALNGLGYQSDNAEIDSSFIDAFVDDELTTVKTSSNKQSLKTKEALVFESTNKQAVEDKSFTEGKYFYGTDLESHDQTSMKVEKDDQMNNKKDMSYKNSRLVSRKKTWEQESKAKKAKKLCKSEDENTSTQRFLLSSKFSERCGVKSFQENSTPRGSAPSQPSTSPTSRARESKKKNAGGGTWSKELIQKIVQQKNKLHKLHVKGTKNLQFSLVMERLTPSVQNPAFGEYDYVSDSDDECGPVKIASQGRLNQSSRCKYTYTKECKWRARSERDQAAWRHKSQECFEMKKSEELALLPEKHGLEQRLRRRGSRSSTSSELSTSVSVSSDGTYSPKSTERTDSDSEKRLDKKNACLEQRSHDTSSPQKLFKESSTLALTFTKSVKKYNTDKVINPDISNTEHQKKHHSTAEAADLMPSLQKARDQIKTSYREKAAYKQEAVSAVALDKLTSQKKHSMSSKEEPAQCCSTKKTPQFDPHTIPKEADFITDRKTKGKGEEGPRAIPPELSGPTTLKKQSDSVCIVKETVTQVDDLDTHKPGSLCQSLMDEVCLSPPESQSPLIQKDSLHLIPYPLDQEQGLVKSPLSFDTSSMFGDLTGFDSGLYSEMPIQKEGFHSIENTPDKKEEFESTFSNFLDQRHWNLGNPVLPDDISQYKINSEKLNVKKPDFGPDSLSMSEKIMDYNANHCASEDELEIKRIVTELENQLQTTKLESPSLLTEDVPKQLQMIKLSPLRLGDECESKGDGLSMTCSDQAMDAPRMLTGPFSEPTLPWTSPFQFELVADHHGPHTPIHNHPAALESQQHHSEQMSGKKSAEKETPLETKEDILEQKRYTENLMKSLEVISGSIFKKEPVISVHKEPNANSLTSQQCEETECQATDAAERGDRCEKEAITVKENISSHPNINERKDEIEFILNESQPSLSNKTDPSVGGNQPISSQPSEPTTSENYKAETQIASEENISASRLLTDSAHPSSVMSHDSPRAEKSGSNADDSVNPQSENNSDSREYSLSDDCKEAEAVVADPTSGVVKKMEQQQSANGNPEDISLAHADKLLVEGSDSRVQEITVETSNPDDLIKLALSKNCSPSNIYCKEDVHERVVSTEKPCSPITMQASTKSCCSPLHDTQSTESQSNLLILSQSDGIINSSPRQMAPFNESLKTETSLIFEVRKQEEMLNVQVIKEHLPVDFMASQQNSPCREEAEESQCVFVDTASPVSPLLSTPHEGAEQEYVRKEDTSESKNECSESIDQGSSQEVASPVTDNNNQNAKEDVNGDHFITPTDMNFSLLTAPQLDLRLMNCKLLTSEMAVSSPLPVRSSANGLEKSDLIYDLKLSPLNYNSLPDEPPRFDYIPISPAGKPEENPHTKMISKEECATFTLSVDPVMIFNKTNPLSVSPDPTAGNRVVLQEEGKLTCFSAGVPTEIKRAEMSTANLKAGIHVFQDSTGPDEQYHLHEDKTENLNSHEPPTEDSTVLKKGFSDGPPTPKPLIICENKQTPPPPDPSEKLPTVDAGQCSVVHKTQKETPQKKMHSNTQQGKELCDICFMCFRTVPGLKRHKAMKHLVRAEKHVGLQSTTPSQHGTAFIYEPPQSTEKNLQDESLTCFPTKKDGQPGINSFIISKTAEKESVSEEMTSEKSGVPMNETGFQNPPLSAKAKKTNKARKSKSSNGNSDPFSDELLKIIKTDILQAITPEFKSSTMQEYSKSAQINVNDRAIAETQEIPHHVTSDIACENTHQSSEGEQVVLSDSVELNEIADTQLMKHVSTTKTHLELCSDNKMKSLSLEEIDKECEESKKTLQVVDEMSDLERSEDGLAGKTLRNVSADVKCEGNKSPSDNPHRLSCLNSSPVSPPSISPDLRALLDDDNTFSQLFPRDDETKRKKCQRVYTKRNKRQKLSPSADVPHDYLPPESFLQTKDECVEARGETFSDNQPNHCEYETISIDDAIMLNMCHNSALKADCKPIAEVNQSHQDEVHEELSGDSLDQSTINKSTSEWSKSSPFNGFETCSDVASEPNICKSEALPPPFPLPPPGYPVEPCLTDTVQTFHSIDIQNINTTFQLPEIQFFDSGKDVLVAPPLETLDMESRDDEKSKKVAERRGRKRQDVGMKVKDKQYKCKVCFTWFLTLGELNFHKLSHNPSPPPTCYMCVQRKFSSREQLRDHLREKHAKNKTGIWTCGMCLKEISDVWMYNEHLREHATQFARKGQTQGSMLGIPGSFMQETAVKNFISSIMQHRPSRTNRESTSSTKEQQQATAGENAVGVGRTSEGAELKLHKAKSSSGKGSTLTSLEVLHKTETTKNVEMHPNCKDPSRDCHHCGKQFPKPFKLQRHLVVHNLERIFLCHKCPVSYQEAQELKEHLKSAHEEAEEFESKHTTLYTCELCADVMHVIKKSFICSTCNYTFSKKEQFDRHMEKHLSEGNKIFKFRGVLRPVTPSASKENECDSPASKKRRILSDSLTENSSDSGIASVSSLHLSQSIDIQPSKPSVATADDSTQTAANEYHNDTTGTNVKTEDIAEDSSGLLEEQERHIQLSPPEFTTPKKEESDPTLSPDVYKENIGKSITEPCDVKEENDSVCIRAETTSWVASKVNAEEEMVKATQGDTTEHEGKTASPAAATEDAFISSRESQISSKTPESAKHELAADQTNCLDGDEQWNHSSDNKSKRRESGVKQEISSQNKDNAGSATMPDITTNITAASGTKAPESTQVLTSKISPNDSATNEDKDSVKQQKKRKDTKSPHTSQRGSPPATQENFGVDSKVKKKFRPSKCANSCLQRKPDGGNEYPVLSSVRDDVVSNKIVSKCKTVNLTLQSKRTMLDSCVQKKTEVVAPHIGDFKTKKGPQGRSVLPKVSSVPMNNPLHKSRPKLGVRTMESHSYRTAESQNFLLSQLFGQKLTSFKIPLRKDASESIN